MEAELRVVVSSDVEARWNLWRNKEGRASVWTDGQFDGRCLRVERGEVPGSAVIRGVQTIRREARVRGTLMKGTGVNRF